MKDFNVLIFDLAKLTKAVNFYPENHPSLIAALNAFVNDINEFAKSSDLIFEITKDTFIVQGQKVLLPHPVLKDLSQTFVLRRVNKLIFHSGVSSQELLHFLQLINMDVGTLYSAGGLEVLIENSDIRNIALSELHLTKLLSKKESQKAAGVGMGVKISAVVENEDVMSKATGLKETTEVEHNLLKHVIGGKNFEEKPKTKEELFAEIVGLLKSSREQNNIGDYLKALKNAGDLIAELSWEEDYDKILKIFELLVSDINNENSIAGIKREAKNFVCNTLNEQRIDLLVALLLKNIQDFKVVDNIRKILSAVGEPAVEVILEKLTASNDLRTRRLLIDEVTKLGEVAFQRVLVHLNDDRWYVVRNMVTILGVFCKDRSLSKLFEVANHPDIRVRKEVVKTLVRISHPTIVPFLLKRLSQEVDDVKLLIIFSLGIIKSKEAVDKFVSILQNEKSLSIKKEVLIALGRIGTKEVFPILKSYALKKGFFKKADTKVLRIAAINGLADIKTKEKCELLEMLLKDSDADIRDAAFEALQKGKVSFGG